MHYNILIDNYDDKKHLEDLGIDGKAVLKRMLRETRCETVEFI
jgi:hypothetical protein